MKTKTLITAMLTAYCLLPTAASAQLPSAQEEKSNYKWGVAVAVNSVDAQIGTPELDAWGYGGASYFFTLNGYYNDKINHSLSLSIIPKYFISDDILLRFEFCVTNIKISTSHFENDVTHTYKSNGTLTDKIYRYIPGIQWNVLKKKRVGVYCGITANYIHYSSLNYSSSSETRALPSDTLTGWGNEQGTNPGGFAAGVGVFTGFAVYLNKRISMGAEFSSAYLYYELGGTHNIENHYQNLPNPPVSTSSNWFSTSYTGFEFSKILSSFNISFNF